MKYLFILLLTGCVSAKYTKTTDLDNNIINETFVVNSLFRSVEGLEVEREQKKFKLKVNKAKPTATPEQLAEALRLLKPL